MTGSEIDTIKLDTWKEVQQYNDNGFLQMPMSYFEHVVQHGNYYPKHAFSSGQLASKSWLLDGGEFGGLETRHLATGCDSVLVKVRYEISNHPG